MDLFVWIGFVAFVVTMIALDLGVFHRRAHRIGFRESLGWAAFWVSLAVAFNVLVYHLYEGHWLGWAHHSAHPLTGRQAALQFFTGYLIEESLSLDNLFVIAVILAYFRVPPAQQHRLLFWGILGAIVMRGLMIGLGTTLIHRFEWITYVFGGLLLFSAVKLLLTQQESIHPERNLVVRLAEKVFTVGGYSGSRFIFRANGRWVVTPLFLALILVETSDVMFAVDSIPAIFAVTRDPFLVFTSNVFAILGLRSLYFALAGLMDRFRYLKFSLVFVLGYVGIKMLLAHYYPISTGFSLLIITIMLAVGILASLWKKPSTHDTAESGGENDEPTETVPLGYKLVQ